MSNKSAASAPKPVSLHEFRKQRKPHRNVYRETTEKLSPMHKLACWITDRVGTMGFFLVVLVWTLLWLGWNLLAPEDLQFDPPTGFVFWLFISNLIQLLLMPLIMVGQNVQGRHSEMRAEHDLEVSVTLIFDQIAAALARGDRIELRGFGAFSVRRRGARIARNPRTGDSVEVAEKHIPFFRAGKQLHQRLNQPD